MDQDKPPPFIGDKIGNTESKKRIKRKIAFSKTEWDRLEKDAAILGKKDRSELIRYRCFDQPDEKADRGRIIPPVDEGKIPEEIKIEAIFAAIHLSRFFEEACKQAGTNDIFKDAREKVKEHLKSSGVLD
jgi:hypothetical protein